MESDEERKQKDLAMAKDPTRWPHWPYLPMKREENGSMVGGTLYASDPPRFARENLWFINSDRRGLTKWEQTEVERLIFEEGWEVD